MNVHYGAEIGRCPGCSNPVGIEYPFNHCSACGQRLPEELLALRQLDVVPAAQPAPEIPLWSSTTAPPFRNQLWRDGKRLVIEKGAHVTGRCIKCNSTLGLRQITFTARYIHPAYYFLICAGVLVYFVVSAFVTKTERFEICLCEDHRLKRWQNVVTGLGLLALSLILLAFFRFSGIAVTAGLLLMLLCPLYLALSLHIMRVHKIDDRYIWVSRVSPSLLQELPPWPSSQSGGC